MKNESRFADARKYAVAAINSVLDTLLSISARNRAPVDYSRIKYAVGKPVNHPAGNKLLAKAQEGKLSLGIHGNGKSAVDGVTFSPKKDIGKGPARTLTFGKRQKASHFQRMQLRDAHLG